MGAGWLHSAPAPAQGEAGRDGHGKRQLVAAAGETELLRGGGAARLPGGRTGREGRESAGRGGGGSARLPGNLKCDKSGKRGVEGVGGKSLPIHPPSLLQKRGVLGEKPLLGKCVRRGRLGGGGERIVLRGWGQPRRQPRQRSTGGGGGGGE